MSWRNNVGEERPRVSLGELANEPLVVRFTDEGKLTETRNGEALEIGAEIEEVPAGYTDMNDQPLETGEEYYIMSSSTRFLRALKNHADRLEGVRAEITAEGSGFDRTYKVNDPQE